MEGEFESLQAIHTACPNLAPHAYCEAKFKNKTPSGSDTHFLLLGDYWKMGEQPPKPTKFTARLAELHMESESPTGMFGFHHDVKCKTIARYQLQGGVMGYSIPEATCPDARAGPSET